MKTLYKTLAAFVLSMACATAGHAYVAAPGQADVPVILVPHNPQLNYQERTLCYNASLRDGVIPRNLDGEVQATALLDPDQMAELVARGKVTAEASLAVLAWLAERTGKILPEGFYKPFRP